MVLRTLLKSFTNSSSKLNLTEFIALFRMISKLNLLNFDRRIQKAVKKAKEDWIGAQCEEIETCINKNNSKRAYQLVKDLTSEKQGRSSAIQDKSGKCLTEEK